MEDLHKKIITIQEVEQTTTQTGKVRFKLKDELGLTFALWKLKADGTETKAFQVLKSFGLDATGKIVELTYKEEQSTYNGKDITFRTIIGIQEVTQTPKPNFDRLASLEERVRKLEGKVFYQEEVSTQDLAQELGGEMVDTTDYKQEIKVEDIPFN